MNFIWQSFAELGDVAGDGKKVGNPLPPPPWGNRMAPPPYHREGEFRKGEISRVLPLALPPSAQSLPLPQMDTRGSSPGPLRGGSGDERAAFSFSRALKEKWGEGSSFSSEPHVRRSRPHTGQLLLLLLLPSKLHLEEALRQKGVIPPPPPPPLLPPAPPPAHQNQKGEGGESPPSLLPRPQPPSLRATTKVRRAGGSAASNHPHAH